MKQKYAIGFITFMLATVLAACVHDYPAMTPDGEEGIDPTLVEVSTEVTLDLELLPLEIITNKAHRGITKARAGEQTDYRRRFIIEAWRDGKPAARHGQCRRSRQRENHAPCPFEAVRRRIHPRRMDGLRCGRHDHRPLL